MKGNRKLYQYFDGLILNKNIKNRINYNKMIKIIK
jgi:hypothetical protein